MKPNSFILKIEKPCTENWNSMTLNDTGKFCSNCQKNVIDFSTCSDDEFIRILEKIDGKVCGRLSKSQLERIYTATKNKKVSPHLNKILAGLFALGMMKSPELNAQNGNKENVVVDANHLNPYLHEHLEKPEMPEPAIDSIKNLVQGKVIDSYSKKPLGYFRVTIANSSVFATTDTAGNFKIQVPDSLMKDSITIQLATAGYEWTETKIAKNDISKPLTIIATEQEMMMGEMIYQPPPKKKKGKK